MDKRKTKHKEKKIAIDAFKEKARIYNEQNPLRFDCDVLTLEDRYGRARR